jgi:guanylate kinase
VSTRSARAAQPEGSGRVKVEQAAQHRRGTVFVISGPSGVGKTSLCKQILATVPQVTQSVAYTTRASRPHEQDGYAYHFISREAFAQRIAAGDFLEWAQVHDHLYGTSRQQVEEATAAGQDILLAIDVQGAAKLRSTEVDAVFVFVLPPDWETLEARLLQRGSEPPEVRMRRLDVARQELEHYTQYDYVVQNEQLDTAAATLRAIIVAERQRMKRVGAAAVAPLLAPHITASMGSRPV